MPLQGSGGSGAAAARFALEDRRQGNNRRSGSVPPQQQLLRGGRPQRSAGGRFVGRGGDQDEAAEALLGMGFGFDVSSPVQLGSTSHLARKVQHLQAVGCNTALHCPWLPPR
jgi:hypothetical protein